MDTSINFDLVSRVVITDKKADGHTWFRAFSRVGSAWGLRFGTTYPIFICGCCGAEDNNCDCNYCTQDVESDTVEHELLSSIESGKNVTVDFNTTGGCHVI